MNLDLVRALPAVAYRDPTWLAAEKARIRHRDWVFATPEDALAPGDQPVLLLRNQSGDLAALSNLCTSGHAAR